MVQESNDSASVIHFSPDWSYCLLIKAISGITKSRHTPTPMWQFSLMYKCHIRPQNVAFVSSRWVRGKWAPVPVSFGRNQLLLLSGTEGLLCVCSVESCINPTGSCWSWIVLNISFKIPFIGSPKISKEMLLQSSTNWHTVLTSYSSRFT